MSSLVLYRNGSIYSAADPFATAMLVEGGTVAWVGSESAASALLDARMEVVDLEGALVAPAFFDSHVHLTETGLALSALDLRGAGSLAQALDAVAGHAAAGTGPVLGSGWDETAWPEGRGPSAEELERAGGGRDVYLARVDLHSAAVSTGLAMRTGLAAHEGWDGAGRVHGPAHAAIRAAVLDLDVSARAGLQRRGLEHLAANGYAAAAEMAAPHLAGRADLETLLCTLEADGDAAPRIYAYWGEAVETADQARSLAGSFGGRLAGLGGDLTVDGSIGSRTARLRAPYADAPQTRGTLHLGAAAIAAHVAACSAAGIQAGFHAIGDAAIDETVAGFALAADRVGLAAVQAGRHRLEHAEMADDAAIQALLGFGVTVSLQPLFDAAWGGTEGLYARRLGAERAAGMNEVGRFLAAGVPVCLGSDSPVVPASPWLAVKACLELNSERARISARAAFLAHTRSGYRAVGEPSPMAGQLGPGTEATFAVWQASELAVQTPDLRVSSWSTDARAGTPLLPVLDEGAPRCLRTVRNGRVIFDASR